MIEEGLDLLLSILRERSVDVKRNRHRGLCLWSAWEPIQLLFLRYAWSSPVAKWSAAFRANLARNGSAIPADRLIAVLQGWEIGPEEIKAQVERAGEAGAAGYIVSRMKIDQGWEPRIVKAVPPSGSSDSADPHVGHKLHE